MKKIRCSFCLDELTLSLIDEAATRNFDDDLDFNGSFLRPRSLFRYRNHWAGNSGCECLLGENPTVQRRFNRLPPTNRDIKAVIGGAGSPPQARLRRRLPANKEDNRNSR